jgi:excisionase family DNA binding protein
MEQLMTVTEVSRLTRLHPQSVYAAIYRGDLRSVTIGPRAVRVTSAALRAFIRERGGIRPASKRKVPQRKNAPKKPAVHLTESQKERLRKMRAKGASYQACADAFGVSKGQAVIVCYGLRTQPDRPVRKAKRKTRRRGKKA